MQSVVASIACDPQVWNAVLKNDALVEFIQSQKTSKNFFFFFFFHFLQVVNICGYSFFCIELALLGVDLN